MQEVAGSHRQASVIVHDCVAARVCVCVPLLVHAPLAVQPWYACSTMPRPCIYSLSYARVPAMSAPSYRASHQPLFPHHQAVPHKFTSVARGALPSPAKPAHTHVSTCCVPPHAYAHPQTHTLTSHTHTHTRTHTQELGFNVIEVNPGMDRTGAQLLRMVGEATQSRRLMHQVRGGSCSDLSACACLCTQGRGGTRAS